MTGKQAIKGSRQEITFRISGYTGKAFHVEYQSVAETLSQEEFCASKGLKESLVKGDTGGILLYPQKRIVVNYYCVTEDQLREQFQNPKYQKLICRTEESEDVSIGTFKLPLDIKYISNFAIRLNNKSSQEFISAIGKEDFSGTATVTDEWDDYSGRQLRVSGIVNNNPDKDDTRGIIEVKYKINDETRTKNIVCKSPLI